MDTEQESAQEVKSGEENSPATPAVNWIRNLSFMSSVLYQLSYPNPQNSTTQKGIEETHFTDHPKISPKGLKGGLSLVRDSSTWIYEVRGFRKQS